MAELVTTGTWQVPPAREAAFVEAWTLFAGWASSMRGSTTLRLGRDLGEPGRFVSFAVWQDADAVRAWKRAPGFRERLAQVVQHVEGFHPAELDVVATATQGSRGLAAAHSAG
jgi:heme-degrading monooxygenase HmoA